MPKCHPCLLCENRMYLKDRIFLWRTWQWSSLSWDELIQSCIKETYKWISTTVFTLITAWSLHLIWWGHLRTAARTGVAFISAGLPVSHFHMTVFCAETISWACSASHSGPTTQGPGPRQQSSLHLCDAQRPNSSLLKFLICSLRLAHVFYLSLL